MFFLSFLLYNFCCFEMSDNSTVVLSIGRGGDSVLFKHSAHHREQSCQDSVLRYFAYGHGFPQFHQLHVGAYWNVDMIIEERR